MKRKIFVNGTFDIVHVGHLRLLEYARTLGDHLTVAIDSDRRVKELKGSNRPINSEYERAVLLSCLRFVDKVIIFDTDEELIEAIKKCDIMVKGSDYEDKLIIGEQYCKVIFYDRLERYSTTKKIQDIIAR